MPQKCKKPFVSAIIVCAGSSSRMGGTDKLFLCVGGDSVAARSIKAFENTECIGEIVIVTRHESIGAMQKLVEDHKINKVSRIIEGGSTRQQSVRRGVDACSLLADYFAVHDGARPLITPRVIADVTAHAICHGAATAAVKVKDTIKLGGPGGFVEETLNREALYTIQTPQVFRKDLYDRAMAKAQGDGSDYTDDCQLLEHADIPVFLSQGSYDNVKITTTEDIAVAEALLKRRENP